MEIRASLLHHLRRSKLPQMVVVERWLERSGAERRRPRTATVSAQLSRLIRHEEAGAVRFFFKSRVLAEALLDVLGVPEWERDDIYAAADEVLRARRRIVRVPHVRDDVA